jgi:tetratricopeptide (TPR) repeat protein
VSFDPITISVAAAAIASLLAGITKALFDRGERNNEQEAKTVTTPRTESKERAFPEQTHQYSGEALSKPDVPGLTTPFQLPPPPADFTGRVAELTELRAAIEKGGVHISGIQGQGGVGKTALALKLAAELAPNFPDAQIYVDLRGVSEKPLTAAEAMSHVLRTFHPEAKLPEKEEELRAQYLSVLHDKRALLLMDNARDAAQVKPLVPPEGCALLVTSRQHFALPGLQAKNLETLPPPDAKDLLLRIAPRIDAEAETIARLCGYLPQALRLAASAMAVRVNLEPADYARQLADEKKRLGLLAGDDESVGASITLSYNLLDAEMQRRGRVLGAFPGTFDVAAAAAVMGLEEDPAQETLGQLLKFSMLEWDEATKRYRLHDLMRAFARSRLSGAEAEDAARRHSEYYCDDVRSADALYRRGGESSMRGLAKLDLEFENIQTGQAWAAAHAVIDPNAAKLCNNYADWGSYILPLRQRPRERIDWREAALAAARQMKDFAAEPRHLGNLGLAYRNLGDYRRAIEFHEKALGLDRAIEDRRGEAEDLANLGSAYQSLADYESAIQRYEESLKIIRETGDRFAEARVLGNLGNTYHFLGELRRAAEYYERALTIAREIGDRSAESAVLGNLGNVFGSMGDFRRAIDYHQRQLIMSREIGDRRSEGSALWNLSLMFDKLGQRGEAIKQAEEVVNIFEQVEDPNAAVVRRQIQLWRGDSTESSS